MICSRNIVNTTIVVLKTKIEIALPALVMALELEAITEADNVSENKYDSNI